MNRFRGVVSKILVPLTEVDIGHENVDSVLTATTNTGCCCAGRRPELKCFRVLVNLLDEVGRVDDVHLPLEYGKGAYWETMLLAIKS